MEKSSEQLVLSQDENLKLVNGVLNYNDTPFSGALVSYFNETNLKSKIQYRNGRKDGFEKRWNNNDVLIEERFYIKGNKSGIHKGWWGYNNPKFEYVFNNRGMYNGNVKEWYENGQLYRSFNYEEGKEVGSQRLWKIDGTIKANYEVVNGERFGLIGLKKCFQVTVGVDEPITAHAETSQEVK